MTKKQAKNLNEAADVLRLRDGKLVDADGNDVSVYLDGWAKELGVTVNTPVNLLPRKLYIELCEQASKYKIYWCSFCGLPQSRVQKCIAGPNVNICNYCLDLCNEIIADSKK